jgi:hypothetical protein
MNSTPVFTQIAARSRWRFTTLIFLFCQISALAQSNAPEPHCPRVSVSSTGNNSSTESPFSFVANVTDACPNQSFSYEWTIYNGMVVQGQGSSKIKVIGKRPLTATVKLTGLPAACVNAVASMSFIPGPPPPPVRQIDEFGSVSFQKLKPHLDQFALQLRNSPGSMGSIVSTRKWPLAKKAVNYLLSKHDIPAERMLFVDQKKKGPMLVKLYIVPAGAVPPG